MPGYYLLRPVAKPAVPVAASSVTVLAANGQRRGAVITNDGTEDLYLGFDEAAVVGSGVVLKPDHSYEIGKQNLFKGQVNGISTATGTTARIAEG